MADGPATKASAISARKTTRTGRFMSGLTVAFGRRRRRRTKVFRKRGRRDNPRESSPAQNPAPKSPSVTHVHGEDERAVGALAHLLRSVPHTSADVRCNFRGELDFHTSWRPGI